MELVPIRIIADIKTGNEDKRVFEYLLEDYQGEEYGQIVDKINSMKDTPFEQMFEAIPGFKKLTPESKESFLKTIVPFLQCQGKGRLINASIDHIEDRKEPEGIRVYLNEYGDLGFQYFRNGSWG